MPVVSLCTILWLNRCFSSRFKKKNFNLVSCVQLYANYFRSQYLQCSTNHDSIHTMSMLPLHDTLHYCTNTNSASISEFLALITRVTDVKTATPFLLGFIIYPLEHAATNTVDKSMKPVQCCKHLNTTQLQDPHCPQLQGYMVVCASCRHHFKFLFPETGLVCVELSKIAETVCFKGLW